METKTKEMIKGWLKSEDGNKEAVAKFISRTINCGIKEARSLVDLVSS